MELVLAKATELWGSVVYSHRQFHPEKQATTSRQKLIPAHTNINTEV